MRQAELTAAQHLLSFFSRPCFSLEIFHEYGTWQNYQVLNRISICLSIA
jgi:hypothetical protein